MSRFVFIICLMLFSLTSFAQKTIRFSHVVNEATPKGQMALKFKELVEDASHGDISVDIYPEASLYNDDAVFNGLISGDVEMAAPALSKFQHLSKKFEVFDLPFLFKDLAAVTCFQQSDAGQQLMRALTNRGIVGLGYLHNGFKQISADTFIDEPSDLAGKKIRIIPSPVLEAQYKAVDAIPVKRPFSQVHMLLNAKVINGQESTWSNMYSQHFHEIQPYIVETNHGPLDYMIVIAKQFWDTLTPAEQTLIRQSADEAIAYGNDMARQINIQDRQKIVQSGKSEIIELSESQRQKWFEKMQPVWAQFESEIGRDLIDTAQKCEY